MEIQLTCDCNYSNAFKINQSCILIHTGSFNSSQWEECFFGDFVHWVILILLGLLILAVRHFPQLGDTIISVTLID